jgi:GT2 family glycosyltransferase
MAKVDIVIPNYSSDQSKIDMLERCIESLGENTTVDYRVIVTDDASPKPFQDKLKELAKKWKFELILKDKNKGFASNSNDGLRIATAPYVLLLNTDIIAHKNFLEHMVIAANETQVGMVSAKLLYPDERIQYAGTFRNPTNQKWFDHMYRFQNSNYPDANKERDIIAFTGACVLIRQEVFKSIGYFDEGFPMAFEDIDFSFRAREDGFRIYFEPKAVCTHLEGATRGKSGISAKELKSLKYFHDKWNEEKVAWFSQIHGVTTNKTIFGQPIIYILEATTISGGIRVVFEHIKQLYDLGYDIHVWSLQGQPNWFTLPIRVRQFVNYESLEHALKQIQGIKIATWWKTAPVVWRACQEKGTPWYLVQDIETSYYPTDNAAKAQVMQTYNLVGMNYLATSKWVESELKNLGLNPHYIGIGIDEQTYFVNQNTPRRPNSILLLGRSQYLKNWDYTVKVIDKIREGDSSVYARMFGVEPGLTIPISFDSFYSPKDNQIADLYRSSSLFIQLSKHEGFCLPILEAMACGTPVVCTDADGNMEFCRNDKNSLIVSKDNAEETASVILQVLKDETIRNRLSVEGIKTAKQYTWDRSIKRVIKAFESVKKG